MSRAGFPNWGYVCEPYATGDDDRWVVVLVVTYDEEAAPTPTEAAALALDLTRDAGAAETVWHVYDRKRERMRPLQQHEFQKLSHTEPSKRKAPDGGRFDVLGALLEAAKAADEPAVRRAAHRAGLLWTCRCGVENRVATSICAGCGHPQG